MLIAILQHAPLWVWALLAGLVILGLIQARDRSMTLTRAGIVPIVMVAMSYMGVTTVFGHQPLALLAWAKGLAASASLTLALRLWRGIEWSARDQRLLVPGSWWPLAIILALFVTKFAVGVNVAIDPSLARNTLFAALVGLVYGAFSGLFLGRGLAMWKVVRHAWSTRVGA